MGRGGQGVGGRAVVQITQHLMAQNRVTFAIIDDEHSGYWAPTLSVPKGSSMAAALVRIRQGNIGYTRGGAPSGSNFGSQACKVERAQGTAHPAPVLQLQTRRSRVAIPSSLHLRASAHVKSGQLRLLVDWLRERI